MGLGVEFDAVRAVLRHEAFAGHVHPPLIVGMAADDDIRVRGPRGDAAHAQRVGRHDAAAARTVKLLHRQRIAASVQLGAEDDPVAVASGIHLVAARGRHPLAKPLRQVCLLVLQHGCLVVPHADADEVLRVGRVEVCGVTDDGVEVIGGASVFRSHARL